MQAPGYPTYPVLTLSSVATRSHALSAPPPLPNAGEADRHAEAAKRRARHTGSLWLTLAAAVIAAAVCSAPDRAYAEEDSTPSILGYALEGFGTGLATGFAVGYLATGPKFEKDEWRTVLLGGGIGALSGTGIGLILGIVDASTVPNGRGVGFYIMRDSNYGYSAGFLVGGVIGAIIWASGGVSKDLLLGMAWGTVIGAGAGMLLGIVEGALRKGSGSHAKRENTLQLGLGFTPRLDGGLGTPYPVMSGHF